MSIQKRVSYGFIVILLGVVASLKLATPLLTVLFSYFLLSKLHVGRSKKLAILLFSLVVTGAFLGFAYFLGQALTAFPEIVRKSVPVITEYAKQWHLELPFSDFDSLRTLAMENARDQIRNVGMVAKFTTLQFAMLVIGLVVAVSMFENARLDLDRESPDARMNFYFECVDEIAVRFRTFYHSFATVMGAQIVISSINTVLTGMFVIWTKMPHASLVIAVTFFCGMLPIIGNILSNTVIVCIALTLSPQFAVSALIFLVALHKFEYFLNSKIIGERIKNPMWLTLLGLILGERLMGIPGMILAPVVLHYLKVELSKVAPTGGFPPAATVEAKDAGPAQ
jgi:predicted PurR-regulated permease PerM